MGNYQSATRLTEPRQQWKKVKKISENSSNEMRQSIYRCMSSNLRQVAADIHQNNSVRSHGVIYHDMNRITSQKVSKIGLEWVCIDNFYYEQYPRRNGTEYKKLSLRKEGSMSIVWHWTIAADCRSRGKGYRSTVLPDWDIWFSTQNRSECPRRRIWTLSWWAKFVWRSCRRVLGYILTNDSPTLIMSHSLLLL